MDEEGRYGDRGQRSSGSVPRSKYHYGFFIDGDHHDDRPARYYSFYCWALWHIQKEERPTKYADFVDAFRRREAAFALATLANNPEASMVGIQAVKPQFHHGRAQGFFDCNFRVLPSNQLGGYGQNYQGSLHDLGLTYPGEDGVNRPQEGIAEELAISFHESVQPTPYLKKHLFTSANIDVKDLDGSKERFTLDALTRPFAKTERLKLTELFFGLTDSSPSSRTILRRQTLTLILHLAGRIRTTRDARKFRH